MSMKNGESEGTIEQCGFNAIESALHDEIERVESYLEATAETVKKVELAKAKLEQLWEAKETLFDLRVGPPGEARAVLAKLHVADRADAKASLKEAVVAEAA